MPPCHGVDGHPPCSPRRSQPRKLFAHPAHGLSRCWVWTPIARQIPIIVTAQQIRYLLADRLMSALALVETPDWLWFEEGLAYDNARLPPGLDCHGHGERGNARLCRSRTTIPALADDATTDVEGHFRPVGTAGFGELRKPPRAFDQQPLEATATIAACLAAWRADGDAEWKTDAARVFAWFLGRNDLSVALRRPRDRKLPRWLIRSVRMKIAGRGRSCRTCLALAKSVDSARDQ